ncbi:hypothetical protein [Bradyrhizobium sp. SBR1B]|uniref:hypothetical protein n=1 Tax=Bradyrhizobium sp. SBR1B TaxID=2663836 RepID=UPI0016058FD2|nr:hypothetical protein [Bradyrhizobium sp. SBR1B]MBB4378457.1 hypothetical protein [Bradyrhizobium sp. SBR1B]
MDSTFTTHLTSAIIAAKAAKLEERRERHRRNAKEHYWRTLQTEPRKAMLLNARRAARRFNVPINITVEDIVIPARCPAFDIPLERSNGVAGEASPSVLRLEPQLGYVKGNVIVVSAKAARDPLARTLLFKALKADPKVVA